MRAHQARPYQDIDEAERRLARKDESEDDPSSYEEEGGSDEDVGEEVAAGADDPKVSSPTILLLRLKLVILADFCFFSSLLSAVYLGLHDERDARKSERRPGRDRVRRRGARRVWVMKANTFCK
jgi:hypothetical protein